MVTGFYDSLFTSDDTIPDYVYHRLPAYCRRHYRFDASLYSLLTRAAAFEDADTPSALTARRLADRRLSGLLLVLLVFTFDIWLDISNPFDLQFTRRHGMNCGRPAGTDLSTTSHRALLGWRYAIDDPRRYESAAR